MEQQRDREPMEIMKYAATKELPSDPERAKMVVLQSPRYTLANDTLLLVDPRDKGRTQIRVVPKHLRRSLMEKSHRGPMGARFSGNRMFKTISQKWWWDGMHHDVLHFAKNRPECAIVSGGGGVSRPPLHQIPVQRPFQIIGVDIMDLPATQQGKKHVLVFQDYLTKWPMVFPFLTRKLTV